jgi:hypothetical protein
LRGIGSAADGSVGYGRSDSYQGTGFSRAEKYANQIGFSRCKAAGAEAQIKKIIYGTSKLVP